jgi:hypothetical protein
MKLIDFDAAFAKAIGRWIEENRGKYGTADELEDAATAFYGEWLKRPADFLDGQTPAAYFDRFADSKELIALLNEYIQNGVPTPDPLLLRLHALGDEEALLELLQNRNAPAEAQMLAVELLREMESEKPMVEYLRWQVERTQEDELLDAAMESLSLMGDRALGPAKIAFAAADDAGKEALLDILARPGADDAVVTFAIDRFKTRKDKRALYAGYLGKLDDERAVEPLLKAAEDRDTSYIDFIEIRSAVERLGGDAPYRDFSDDPTYLAVQRLQLR